MVKIERKKTEEKIGRQQYWQKKKMLIRNRLLQEDERVNLNCKNKFNIRVQNFRKFGPGAAGSLDSFV